MIAKAHLVSGRKLVAVCDDGILGKKLEEKSLQIDLTGEYFKGRKVSEEELDDLLKGAFAVSFAGRDSVGFGLRKGLVKEEGVTEVSGVPHAQAFYVD